jgi:hypothetical protein
MSITLYWDFLVIVFLPSRVLVFFGRVVRLVFGRIFLVSVFLVCSFLSLYLRFLKYLYPSASVM